MADAWLAAGAMTVSRDDLRIAREFLRRRAGWSRGRRELLQLARGAVARAAMTREAVVLFAHVLTAERG